MCMRYQTSMVMLAKQRVSATACQPVASVGKSSRPRTKARAPSWDFKTGQKSTSTTLVLKWYQHTWQRLPTAWPASPAAGLAKRMAGLPKKSASPLSGLGQLGSHVWRPAKPSAGRPSEIWFVLPRKAPSPTTVLVGIRRRPWSTIMLVSVFPLAKKQPLPTSTVSGSMICSDIELPRPTRAPQQRRKNACTEASPSASEARAAMRIFRAASWARTLWSGRSMGTRVRGSTRQAIIVRPSWKSTFATAPMAAVAGISQRCSVRVDGSSSSGPPG
mmetsp:Transcript_53682/g.152973  ORF Transcript_53682/g.152973 Transcript_53682/m.152973 type:complete len:274 (+) Transcript_53682:108-929(+)